MVKFVFPSDVLLYLIIIIYLHITFNSLNNDYNGYSQNMYIIDTHTHVECRKSCISRTNTTFLCTYKNNKYWKTVIIAFQYSFFFLKSKQFLNTYFKISLYSSYFIITAFHHVNTEDCIITFLKRKQTIFYYCSFQIN